MHMLTKTHYQSPAKNVRLYKKNYNTWTQQSSDI